MPAVLPETYRDLFGKEVDWQPPEPVTFWFARHGQSEYNVEDRIGGDSSITAKGQRFADALPALFGRVLQATSEDPRFISVWTSTLLRTIQTASKLPLPQVHLSELDEIHAGVCDGATYPYIKTYMPYVHYSRKKDKLRYRYPSGESYIDLCRRTWPVLQRLKRHGGARLIVGHQAVLRCIFGYLEGRNLEEITHLSVPHHQIFQFTVYPDGSVERKDFPMEIVTEAPGGPETMQWPFDVSHSRPLTATDVARTAPKPKVPLLVNRTASLLDVMPADAEAAAAAAPEGGCNGEAGDGGEATHRTVERNLSLNVGHLAAGDGSLGDASTPRLCQSVPRALHCLPQRAVHTEPPLQRASTAEWPRGAAMASPDRPAAHPDLGSPTLTSPVPVDGGESFAAPSFASSIPEKCCSVHRSDSGPGQTVQALRPMDSSGALSSLIGSKAGPRVTTTQSTAGDGGSLEAGAGPQVACPSCGEVFVSPVRARSSPRASTLDDGCGICSKPPSRNLSSAFEMDDCAPEAAAGATLTVSASAVGDWSSALDNYPGSPCAPYPLIGSASTPRQKDDLAAAFVELRTGGSVPPVLGAADGAAGEFVADDPRVHAEAQRRRAVDEHGFRFRRDVCVLLETSALAPPPGEVHAEDDLLRPAELAW